MKAKTKIVTVDYVRAVVIEPGAHDIEPGVLENIPICRAVDLTHA